MLCTWWPAAQSSRGALLPCPLLGGCAERPPLAGRPGFPQRRDRLASLLWRPTPLAFWPRSDAPVLPLLCPPLPPLTPTRPPWLPHPSSYGTCPPPPRPPTVAREEAIIEPAAKRKAQDKRIAGLTADLKTASAALGSPTRTAVSLASSALLFLAYRLLSSAYAGTVVARLPFEPPPFVRGMTHRGLPAGAAAADASFAAIYAVATMALKANLQRALGFAPPRGMYDALKASRKMAEEHADKLS